MTSKYIAHISTNYDQTRFKDSHWNRYWVVADSFTILLWRKELLTMKAQEKESGITINNTNLKICSKQKALSL